MRQGIQRPGGPVRVRRGGAQQPRAVLDEVAERPAGTGGDAASGRHPAEARALSGQSGAVRARMAAISRPASRKREPRRNWGAVGACSPSRLPSWGKDKLFRRPKPTRGSERSTSLGVSQAASGLGDLAIYEGRFSDAVRILAEGAAADLASKNPDRAAAKLRHARPRAAPPRTEEQRLSPRPNERWRSAPRRKSDSSQPESLWRPAR